MDQIYKISRSSWVSPTARDHQRGVKPPRPTDKGIPLSQQVGMLIDAEGMGNAESERCGWRQNDQDDRRGQQPSSNRGASSDMGNANNEGPQGCSMPRTDQGEGSPGERSARQTGSVDRPWDDLKWLPCSDGKARPVKPGIFPLAHGVPARVGKLRAAGNAIVPQVAAEFIKAADDAIRKIRHP